MRIENEVKLDFSDVLFVPKRSTLSSRKEVSLERTYQFKHSGATWTGVPIMAANMDGVGTFEMAVALSNYNMITCLVKSYNLDDFENNITSFFTYNTAVSTGTSDKDFQKLEMINNMYPDMVQFICIDVANGYSEHFGDFVARVRKLYPTKTIIAGNVVTADMTQELILRGADIVKVGIGPGSVCTTRIQTGVGYPQLSAIIECADAAHGLGGHIIADGGCTCPGDIAKAFGGGADFVMLGGMLSGTVQGGGAVIEEVYETNQVIIDPETGDRLGKLEERKKFVLFYGMSSETAMEKHHGGVAEYRSSEGRTVKVPYKGDVNNVVRNILGGLRSTCTYVGATSLKHLSKCTTFVRVNSQYNKVYIDK
jgi:GMP reductase